MIRLTLTTGEIVTVEWDNGITTNEELDSVFSGTACVDRNNGDPNVHNMLFGVAEDENLEDYSVHGDYVRVTSAKWVDGDPPNSFHGYVIDYMNTQGIKTLFDIADGNDPAYKIMDAISNYTMGFEEAVEELINDDGLEFVFGNRFSLYNLFSLVVREIVREYLRGIDMY